MRSIFSKIHLAFTSLYREFILWLPDEYSKFRVSYYNRRGCNIERFVSISPNVRLRGRVEIGTGSSIAQNSSIAGMSVGVRIGRNVMITPNVVIVAFDHGYMEKSIPMTKQHNVEAPVIIEDDVWIGANATICKGVTIGSGSIIGANNLVRSDVAPMSIFGGVPAKLIGTR